MHWARSWPGARRPKFAATGRCKRPISRTPDDARNPQLPHHCGSGHITQGIDLTLRDGEVSGVRSALDAVHARFPRSSERERQSGATLSGGERRMLAMARVMVGEPRLLPIDEPSEGLRESGFCQRIPARMKLWTNCRWNSRKEINNGADVINVAAVMTDQSIP